MIFTSKPTLFVLVYTFIGSFLAVIHFWLAGYVDLSDFVLITLISPVFLLSWALAAILRKVIYIDADGRTRISLKGIFDYRYQGLIPRSFYFFWIWTSYILLTFVLEITPPAMILLGFKEAEFISLISSHTTLIYFTAIVAFMLMVFELFKIAFDIGKLGGIDTA